MTASTIDADYDYDFDVDTDVFIVASSGRTARKYSGSFEDAQEVIEWVEENGAAGELLPYENDAPKIVRVVNCGAGAVVDLNPYDYLVLDKGVFFADDQYVYEPNPNDYFLDTEADD